MQAAQGDCPAMNSQCNGMEQSPWADVCRGSVSGSILNVSHLNWVGRKAENCEPNQ